MAQNKFIKPATNMIELVHGIKLIVSEYLDTQMIGMEILVPVRYYYSEEGKKKINDAIQSVQEYLISLD